MTTISTAAAPDRDAPENTGQKPKAAWNPRDVADLYPLTPMQRLMLAHSQAPAANQAELLVEQLSCRLQGDLDPNALKRAWEIVVARHAVMRTSFAWDGLKQPLQVVWRKATLPWQEFDWRDVDEAQRHERLVAVRHERRDGLRLDRAPLFDLLLIRSGESQFDFVFTCHHAALDGWCLAQVLREVFLAYEATRQSPADGQLSETDLFDSPRPFRDYVAWLGEQDPQQSTAFWSDYLGDYAGQPALPVAGRRTALAIEGPQFGHVEVTLQAELGDKLAELAQRARVTPAVVLQAAWGLLLARYLEREEVVFGVTVSGRPPELRGVESMVGPLMNNVPLSLRVRPEQPLGDWFAELQSKGLERAAFEHTPLDEIHAAVRSAGKLPAAAPLFESLVVFENYPLDELPERASLRLSDLQWTATSRFPLTLVALPGRQMMLRLSHDLRTFDEPTAGRLLGHLVAILESFAQLGGEGTASQVALVTGDQRDAILAAKRLPAEQPTDDSESQAAAHRAHQPLDLLGEITAMLDAIQLDYLALCDRNRIIKAALARLNCETLSPEAVDVFVLAPGGALAPWGVPGELYLGGEALANLAEHEDVRPCSAPDGPGPVFATGLRARWLAPAAEEAVDGAESQTEHQGYDQLEYLGPADAAFEAGAYRVDPAEIETALAEHPLSKEVAVLCRDTPLGTSLAAYVAPIDESRTILDSEDGTLVMAQLRAFLRQRLPEPLVPAAFICLVELPRSVDGQLDVAALPAASRPRPAEVGEYVAPRNDLEAEVAQLWAELLGLERVGIRDDFRDLGGDSMLAVCLMARVEDHFGRRLPLTSLFREATIEYLAELLTRAPQSSAADCLVPIRDTGARAPLFCIHPGGGTVFCYLPLAADLPEDTPVYGIQAQGIDDDAVPHATVEDMAAHYLPIVRKVQPEGPYQFCGWSSGGIIAYEMARLLREAGESVELLALVDAGAASPDEDYDEEDFISVLQMMFPGVTRDEIDEVRSLGPDEQLTYFTKRAEQAQQLVGGTDHQQARRVFDVFQAGAKAMVDYRPQPYDGTLLLIRGTQQATPMHKDPQMGWGRVVKGEIKIAHVEGDHVAMFEEPTVSHIAAAIAPHLGD